MEPSGGPAPAELDEDDIAAGFGEDAAELVAELCAGGDRGGVAVVAEDCREERSRAELPARDGAGDQGAREAVGARHGEARVAIDGEHGVVDGDLVGG